MGGGISASRQLHNGLVTGGCKGAHPVTHNIIAIGVAEDVEGLSHSHLMGVASHAEGGGGGAGRAGCRGLGGAAIAVLEPALIALVTLVAVIIVGACTMTCVSGSV